MKATKGQRWPAAIANSAAVLVFLLAAGAPRMLANTVTSTLGVSNLGSGFTGPFGAVTIDLTNSTTAIITFSSDTNGGNLYLMGGAKAADLNVRGAFDVSSSVTESNSGSGFKPKSSSYTVGGTKVDGFGKFDFTLNNKDGFKNSASSISFTLDAISGNTWSSAANVLTANNKGYDAAAHIFVCKMPCTESEGATATSFAAETAGHFTAPEPGSVTLVGVVLLAFISLAAHSRRKLLA